MKKGTWLALGAYTSWGLLPAYWRILHHVPPSQVIMHRMIWSCVLLVAIVTITRQTRDFVTLKFTRAVIGIYLLAAVLVGINWSLFIWAITSGHYVQTSLGYFINPILSVLMGVFFLRERLRPLQWLPVAMVTAGVIYLAIAYGALPWIALSLAFSFGLYGLVKKLAPLDTIHGLLLETSLLLLPATGFLFYADRTGEGVFLHQGIATDLLLISAGPVTCIPLILFASAMRRIPLSLAGVLQYITPTLQFLLGVLVYREPFTRVQLVGFSIVWLALIIFGVEGFLAHREEPVELV